MDQQKLEAFGERIFGEINAGLSCLTLYLGYRLGLYQAIVDAGAATSAELANRTGYSERYLREWLECMAAGQYLDHEPVTGRFSLPPEHAAVLCDRDHPAFGIPYMLFIPSGSSILDKLMDAFRTGGGVPYEAYGQDCVEALELASRPMYLHDLASTFMPTMPDIEARLRKGGRVLEVGCGAGWSSIALARGFPQAQIDALDPDEASIQRARKNAEEAGVLERINFHREAIEETSLQGPYDLITAFECIHDMPYPVKALNRMHGMVADDGAVLIMDEAVGETLQENINLIGHFNYNFSVLHCLPQAMGFSGSAGTGAVMSASTLRGYTEKAGFKEMNVLPIEHPSYRFYRLTP